MNLQNVARYTHTVRHLRLKQILFRLYYACRKVQENPTQIQQPRQWTKIWAAPAAFNSCFTPEGDLRFLGETGSLNTHLLWNDTNRSKLWLYNLHYLDELNSMDADNRYDLIHNLIERWHLENPPCKGNGWEPYPLSLRIVNLVKWYSRHSHAVTQNLLRSLTTQAAVLGRKVEYHILGNHLFANGKALVFVGSYLEGGHAARWLRQGLKILDHEINEQFLKDGAHFELSPMYHASLLWDLCDLVNLANQSGLSELLLRKKTWQTTIEQGLTWLSAMLHPDGDISFFNDAALGVAPHFAEIKKYATQLGIKGIDERKSDFSLQWLKDSGYCVVNLGGDCKAIVDIADIGPNYQPGHAHADTLSFELSLRGQRFLVNSGISRYGDDELRQHQRSTKAHNTVGINGQNSSDVWAGFRVARRAYPKKASIFKDANQIKISCAHDGYKRLSGKNMHSREWTFTKNNLMIQDHITGPFEVAEARYYLHPDIQINHIKPDGITCCFSGDQQVMMYFIGADNFSVESASWYPAFGAAFSNYCLVLKFKGNELLTQIEW